MCRQFGLPLSLDPAAIGGQLRPIMPQELRELQLDPDHFKFESFGQRTFNDLLALIVVSGVNLKVLKDGRNPNWCHDVQSHPSHPRYVGPTGVTRL